MQSIWIGRCVLWFSVVVQQTAPAQSLIVEDAAKDERTHSQCTSTALESPPPPALVEQNKMGARKVESDSNARRSLSARNEDNKIEIAARAGIYAMLAAIKVHRTVAAVLESACLAPRNLLPMNYDIEMESAVEKWYPCQTPLLLGRQRQLWRQ